MQHKTNEFLSNKTFMRCISLLDTMSKCLLFPSKDWLTWEGKCCVSPAVWATEKQRQQILGQRITFIYDKISKLHNIYPKYNWTKIAKISPHNYRNLIYITKRLLSTVEPLCIKKVDMKISLFIWNNWIYE